MMWPLFSFKILGELFQQFRYMMPQTIQAPLVRVAYKCSRSWFLFWISHIHNHIWHMVELVWLFIVCKFKPKVQILDNNIFFTFSKCHFSKGGSAWALYLLFFPQGRPTFSLLKSRKWWLCQNPKSATGWFENKLILTLCFLIVWLPSMYHIHLGLHGNEDIIVLYLIIIVELEVWSFSIVFIFSPWLCFSGWPSHHICCFKSTQQSRFFSYYHVVCDVCKW